MQCFAFFSLLQWKLHWTPWNFLSLYVGASKTPHLIGDTHDPCTQTFEHHVPCHNPALSETAPCRYTVIPAFSVGRWLLTEQPVTLVQWLLLSAFFSGTGETSFGLLYMLEQAKQHTSLGDTHDPCTQTLEHHVPRHNPALRETGPCPGQRRPDSMGVKTYLQISDFGYGQVAKP